MSLFLLQQRHLKSLSGSLPEAYPVPFVAEIVFGPEDAFGVASKERTTLVRGSSGGGVLWNANEDICSFTGPLIETISQTTKLGPLDIAFKGNVLTLRTTASSYENALTNATSANQLLPAIMSLRLGTYVWIKSFQVSIGQANFNFETSAAIHRMRVTTTEERSRELIACISDWCHFKKEHKRFFQCLVLSSSSRASVSPPALFYCNGVGSDFKPYKVD